jgi:hypothetical protein
MSDSSDQVCLDTKYWFPRQDICGPGSSLLGTMMLANDVNRPTGGAGFTDVGHESLNHPRMHGSMGLPR